MADQGIEYLAKTIAEEAMRIKDEARAEQKRYRKALWSTGYVVGSIALCVAGFLILPPLMSYVSGALYKESLKRSNRDDDDNDWGPVMERKEKTNEASNENQ